MLSDEGCTLQSNLSNMEQARQEAREVLGDAAGDENLVANVAAKILKERREKESERRQKELERREKELERLEKESLVEFQVWKYGVPTLELAGGSGTPSSSAHHAVSPISCTFETVKNMEWKLMHKSMLYSGDSNPEKPLRYVSEGDVARYAYSCLSDVLKGLKQLNRHNVELYNEYTVASIRPDLVVMMMNGRPVGYCEVKKPDVLGRPERPLEDSKVLGQAYDYAMDLRHEHGVQWAFVLVTTFTHWRVVWLDDACSRKAAALDRMDHIDEVCDVHPVDVSGRRLCVSKVLDAQGNPAVGAFLGSVLLKMVWSPVSEIACTYRLWPWVSRLGISWKPFSFGETTVAFPNDPKPPFVRIRQLGSGRDGMCWEVAKGRFRFAMKIIRKREDISVTTVAAEEAKRWKIIWGIEARSVVVMGRTALVMPLIRTFRTEYEFREHVMKAKDALRHIAKMHYAHNDLRRRDGSIKWEHFGFVATGDGSEKMVVLDLSDMSKVRSELDGTEAMGIDNLLS